MVGKTLIMVEGSHICESLYRVFFGCISALKSRRYLDLGRFLRKEPHKTRNAQQNQTTSKNKATDKTYNHF